MSKQIWVTFQCVACEKKSEAPTIKPTPGKPAVAWKECQTCGTNHLLSFRKELGGGPQAFNYTVIDAELTEKGKEAANALVEARKPKTVEAAQEPNYGMNV